MPFVPREEFEHLTREREALTEQLAQYDEMLPLIALAGTLKEELIEQLEVNPHLSAMQIGELAFRKVLDSSVKEARDEVATAYEQEHRRALYARLIAEVDEVEGIDIAKAVRIKVETDPEVALELRNSARAELAARALDVIRFEVTEEQQEEINKEAERQIALDKIDVDFAISGFVDLTCPELLELLEPNDRLKLIYKDRNERKQKVSLLWTIDVEQRCGWQFESGDITFRNNQGYAAEHNPNYFIIPSTLNADMKQGQSVVEKNALRAGKTLAFVQQIGKKAQAIFPRDRNNSAYSKGIVIVGTDFQTRNIEFFGETTQSN